MRVWAVYAVPAHILVQRDFGLQPGNAPLFSHQSVHALIDRLVVQRTFATQMRVHGVGAILQRLAAPEQLQALIAMLHDIDARLALGRVRLARRDPDLAALELA